MLIQLREKKFLHVIYFHNNNIHHQQVNNRKNFLLNNQFILYIENLLTGPKSPNGELVHIQPSIEDRHERTGSVKFADQFDQGKEVLKTTILLFKKSLIFHFF